MTAETPARVYFSQGQQINADHIDNINNYILERVRESVEADALTEDEIEHLKDVYVWTAQADRAYGLMQARHCVALVGPRGCGRRITGVAVACKLGVTPHSLYLDPDDKRPDLPADPGCGYIVEIDQQTIRDIPAISTLLASYGERLAAADAYLVITTTQETWNLLELRTIFEAVAISPPRPVDVFRSHLRRTHSEVAGFWAEHPNVVEALGGASPADAVRLADLAANVLSGKSDAEPVQEALAAYRNWSDELRSWFGTHQDGYHRALLLATAALNDAEAATVFSAADQLSNLVKLPREPGGALVGNGTAKLLEEIEAQPTADGRIRLPRPAYPTSVLDYVWEDRPHLREDLKRWLTEFPGTLQDPSAQYAGYSLIELAIRQGHAALIRHAVGVWAEQPRCQALAAAALTEAGVSASIGREIRRQMYAWATRAGTTQSLQLTIADVCGGPFGKNFPRNAMTRLRHLAINGAPAVRDRVTAAITELMEEPHLRAFALREVVKWATDTGRLRIPGIQAFLAVASALADSLYELSGQEQRTLVADGWRTALRDPEHAADARRGFAGWLEAVAQDRAPRKTVLAVLADTCRNSYDIGILVPAVLQWARTETEPTPTSRDDIATELLQLIADRDPLTPGVSPVQVHRAAEEDSR